MSVMALAIELVSTTGVHLGLNKDGVHIEFV